MRIEEWKSIPGYEGHYECSSFGRIRSIDRYVKAGANSKNKIQIKRGRILKQEICNSGYFRLELKRDGFVKKFLVHRIVALCFIYNENKEKDCVNHKNGIKTDNRSDNLEWINRSENQKHAYSLGLQKRAVGSQRGRVCKLNESVVFLIKKNLKSGEMCLNLAKKYNVNASTIYNIKNKKTWAHV